MRLLLILIFGFLVAAALAADPDFFVFNEKPWDKKPIQKRKEADCTDLRVDPSPFGKTRFQGKMGWCYAYATSDLISHCLKSGPISAADLSMNYAHLFWDRRKTEDFLELVSHGGVPWEAYSALRKRRNGACPERYMTSDPGSFHDLRKLPELSEYEQMEYGTYELMSKLVALRSEYDLTRTKTGTGNLSCADPCGTDRSCFKTLSAAKPEIFRDSRFLKILSETTVSNYFETLNGKLCDAHRLPLAACGNMTAWNAAEGGGHSLFSEVDRKIGSGFPVEFSANSGFLTSTDGKDTGGGPHAMLVIGRKFRKAKDGSPEGCYYQVRNSWGPTCDGYSEFVKDCDPETGYFWISEETLGKNLFSINYFGP